MKKEETKSYLTFKEMLVEYKKRPKVDYLWNGIKDRSFGLFFGPSKSGKTIFCENLAMCLAVGKKDYFAYTLSGKSRKVLFIGLEEYWEMRMDRNSKQFEALNKEEKELLEQNYLYQKIDFNRHIHKKEDWDKLSSLILESQAEVVFIDSITRMNHGSLEDSKTAEVIMQRLRNICYDLSITLICVHHTPKMYDKPLTMDSIKGSSVFAQESDFAIGISRSSKGYRFIKNVFFRYAPDDAETVKEFEIDENIWLKSIGDVDENELLKRSDRRRTDNKRLQIVEYLDSNSNSTYSSSELVPVLMQNLTLKERMVKSYLSELSSSNKIDGTRRGYYRSVNYVNTKEDEARKK